MCDPKNRTTDPSNYPADGFVSLEALDSKSAVELVDAMEKSLDDMTVETYDEALIDAYLTVLDRKVPLPEIPDVETAFEDFQALRRLVGTIEGPIELSTSKRPAKVRKTFRVALAAALVVICMIGTMAIAQASGIDVWGAVARWTNEVFSFGQISSSAADYGVTDAKDKGSAGFSQDKYTEETCEDYATLQEALDANGISEIVAPTKIPDELALSQISATHEVNTGAFDLYAEYSNDDALLQITIMSYSGVPAIQIEKTDAPVTEYEVNGITFYEIENINNKVIAWTTANYECYVSGTVDTDILQQVAFSTCVNQQSK